jgi:N-acetylglucosaminyl-diphospho-decaprenol L-rhamnosyltransferase
MRGDKTQAVGPVDVSVVIVHYETPELLVECLQGLAGSTGGVTTEVFVVDNASSGFDPSTARRAFPGVRVLVNDTNAGFATASNQGLRLATGRYRLLLNPDTVVAPDTLATMVTYMDGRPDVGCATCRLELEDGSLDLASRRLFPTPIRSFYRLTLLSRLFPRSHRFGQYNLTYLDEREEAEIDSPCGAFMMVRKEVTKGVGLLDESYFMYGEDLDWAFRIKAAGWRIMYTPATTVRHRKRASSRRFRQRTIRYFHDGMRRFYATHYASTQPRLVNAVIMAAISLRERVELTGEAMRRHARRRYG